MRPRFLVAIFAAAACASCTQSLDLDRFHKTGATEEPLSNVTYYDLRFTARSMQSHIDEYLELRIVDKSNAVQAKAIYTNITLPDFVMQMNRIVPKSNPPYRIDMWADHNRSKKYDGIEGGVNDKDHAWRRMLSDPFPEDVRLAGRRYDFDFLHDTSFVDIYTDLQGNKISGEDTLLPLTLRVKGAGPQKAVEVRVFDRASTRMVGLYRNGRPTGDFNAQILGVLDEVTDYHVSIFVDEDGDGFAGPGDPSWNMDLTSSTSGLEAQIDLGSAPRSPIEMDVTP